MEVKDKYILPKWDWEWLDETISKVHHRRWPFSWFVGSHARLGCPEIESAPREGVRKSPSRLALEDRGTRRNPTSTPTYVEGGLDKALKCLEGETCLSLPGRIQATSDGEGPHFWHGESSRVLRFRTTKCFRMHWPCHAMQHRTFQSPIRLVELNQADNPFPTKGNWTSNSTPPRWTRGRIDFSVLFQCASGKNEGVVWDFMNYVILQRWSQTADTVWAPWAYSLIKVKQWTLPLMNCWKSFFGKGQSGCASCQWLLGFTCLLHFIYSPRKILDVCVGIRV